MTDDPLVSGAVWILRRTQPELRRGYRVPLVPLIPILSMLASLVLIVSLPLVTIIRFIVWLVIGLVIYFLYSQHKSHLRQEVPQWVQEAIEEEKKVL